MAGRTMLKARKTIRGPKPVSPRVPNGCIGICYWCNRGVPYGSGWENVVIDNQTRLTHGSARKCQDLGVELPW